jgi:transposase
MDVIPKKGGIMSMKKSWDEPRQEALQRYQLIAPLFEEGLSEGEKKTLRRMIRERTKISERTLRRYIQQYKQGGFDALYPKERKDKGSMKSITEEALNLAVEIRKELPSRSAERVQELLKDEGYNVKRSTLDRHLRQHGATVKALGKPIGVSGRRFVRSGRNSLWQADLKYGPYLKKPDQPGKTMRTYLLAIMDDATRYVVHAEFYAHQRQPIIEDSLRKAVLRCGVPGALYVDNGKIFISEWTRLACAKLGIRHLSTKPYSPESKGNVKKMKM